jgi:hypothetical protein
MEVPVSKLNSKTLTIAAVLLLVLALLFVASPLLRVSGITGRNGFNQQFNGQSLPGGQNGFPGLNNGNQGQGFTGPNSDTQNPGTNTNRQFAGRGGGLLGFGFLGGITGTIVYAIALLVALAAAVGMFLTKRWGQVLGIVMGVVYLLLSLVSIIPMLLTSLMRGFNALSLGLSVLHLVLAIAVIVLAVIPAKKVIVPVLPTTPPEAGA